jgi:protein-L-isoaspartate(D-aspartate) O-methyltransferase
MATPVRFLSVPALVAISLLPLGSCTPEVTAVSGAEPPAEKRLAEDRAAMVENQLRRRDIRDGKVLAAMGKVPRHLFVPDALRSEAYADHPLPIGHGQTISQPYIVALMTQLALSGPCRRALDVGTGSGYQAAVLAELVPEVLSIEILCPLATEARSRLTRLGYKNIEVRCGDGYQGWPDRAPFDAIIVAAAAPGVPQPLVDQLAAGGRLVIPVGEEDQELLLLEKRKDGGTRTRRFGAVRFVPMTGEARR